jgi:streptogrisin C
MVLSGNNRLRFERHRSRRRVALVLGAAAAAVGSVVVVPAAAPAAGLPAGFTSPQPPPPDLRPLPPAGTRAALVAAAVRTYGITEQQAGNDLDVQYRAPEIVNELQAALGSGYAGVWFDMVSGKFKIDVAPSTNIAAVAQVENYFGIGSDAEQVPVNFTWDQLSAVQSTWAERVKALPAQDLATVGINVAENAVVVSASKNAPAADVESLASDAATGNATTAGPPVKVVRSNVTTPPVPASCSYSYDAYYGQNDAYCDAPLRGGVGIQNNAAGCTSGFLTYVPWLNGGGGGYDIMTAGHCVGGNGSSWSTYQADQNTFRWIGPPAGWYQDGRGDAALLGITGPYFCYSFSGYCNGSNAAGYNVEFDVYQSCTGNPYCAYNENYPIYGSGASYYNMPACFNGRFSSTSCGYDSNPNLIDVTFYGIGNSTYNDSCAVHGDSGSAVYWGSTGFGIIDSAYICPNAGVFYTEVQPALAAFGLDSSDI